MSLRTFYILPCLLLLLLAGCESRLTDDPKASVSFSVDTLSFDTVFTCSGSPTRRVLVYNPNDRALLISSVRMQSGQSFRINLDGEQTLDYMKDIRLNGGDSLFLFVRATIDPTGQDQPQLVEDNILFDVGDHTATLHLQAYGWDVHLIDSLELTHDTTFTAGKAYLIRNYLLIDKGATLTIQPGAHFYMHDHAQIACYGGLIAKGTLEQPILFSSDRLDDLFEGIPYSYVGGKWDGLYLVEPDTAFLDYVDILSANIGLYLEGSGKEHLTLLNSRIHNHSLYGLVLQQTDALVANSEISNCAQYCVYLASGRFDFVHTTIASYFNSTRYAIQTTIRQDSISPLYINNLSKNRRPTEIHLLNSILSGAKKNCLMLATPLPQYYTGEMAFSYLQTDTLPGSYAHDLIYGQRGDTLFVNTFYGEKDEYYDFHLDSCSHARGIADSLIATQYPLDRDGHSRILSHPDAGCYQYQ